MDQRRKLSELIEQNLSVLADVFRTNLNDYFFTEKELHAYFYHLSVNSGAFRHRDYYLIHTEYPSPFKCSYRDDSPYIKYEAANSEAQRSHIDCVLINPVFIDWVLDNHHNLKPLIGIGDVRFDLYIGDFYDTYAKFNRETGEAVLLYAIEFKFLRHAYTGSKYPGREIHRDIAKLRLLREFGKDLSYKIDFVLRTKAVIFVGERTQAAGKKIKAELGRYDPEEYVVITRKA